MLTYVWPIALVVLSNVVYHICAKSIPSNVSPFLSLTITYFIGAIFTFILFFLTNSSHNVVKELSHMNWAPYVLGIAIVGLEIGFIYAYKAGWQVNSAAIVQSVFLAIALIIVGIVLYKEGVTWNKLAGIGTCLVGIILINWK